MPQTERLSYICRRLSEGASIDARGLADALQVNRATIFRDMEFLRDRLHAPIVWDAEDGTYRLEPHNGVGARFILPGMWMDAQEIYGMLTVLNIAAAVDPGIAEKYRREFAGLLKASMSEHGIERYRLNEKISVELPRPAPAAQAAMRVIGPALVLDSPLLLFAKGLPDAGIYVTPTGLRLRSDGWWLEYRAADDDASAALPLTDVERAEAVNNLRDLRR